MKKRPFNQKAYNEFDGSSKKRLVEVIEKNSEYVLDCDLNEEMFKKGDVFFRKNKKRVLFENEVRQYFDDIISKFTTIHIPIRKQNTPANFYIVWKPDLNQFILIDRKTLIKNKNNIVKVKCWNDEIGYYYEDFLDIPKEETQWYVIGEELKLIKLSYD